MDFVDKHSLDIGMLEAAMTMVLNGNICNFEDNLYIQKSGTAIGTRMAPVFANIFMASLESKIFDGFQLSPEFWCRLIDDIFCIWLHGQDTLIKFIDHINSIHDSIRVTANWSENSVDYLDTNVSVNNGVIETDLFSKPTDTHQYLHNTSCHPRHCKENLPYSLTLRLRRICSNDTTFKHRCAELREFFIAKGYKPVLVDRQIARGNIDRNVALEPRSQERDKRTPFVLDYHPAMANAGRILYKHFPVVTSSDRLRKAIPPPLVAFRRPKNLKDMLVHSRMRNKTPGEVRGNFNCRDSRCQLCPNLILGDKFTSTTTGRVFTINQTFDCNAKNVVYVISCSTCNMQYVGSTNSLRLRYNNHKSRMRNHCKLADKNSDDFIYKHFNQVGHQSFKIQVIDVCDPTEPTDREGFWQYKLRTLMPYGLNSDDLFGTHQKGPRSGKRS